MDLLKWLGLMMLALVLIWIIGGGLARDEKPFIVSPTLWQPIQQYGNSIVPDTGSLINLPKNSNEGDAIISNEDTISIFNGKISISGRSGTYTSDPNKEYITITASRNNLQPINITNWKLKSAITGVSVIIGKGSYLPYSGRVNSEDTIFLRPGDFATIVSGESPIGISFKLNMCTGYFAQFQDFTPRLPLECPNPLYEDYVSSGPNRLNDVCLDYLQNLNRCTMPISGIPANLENNCREFLSEKINYNGCVNNHKYEDDFYKSEWRIYLRRNEDLWKQKRETIILLDEKGQAVDSYSY